MAVGLIVVVIAIVVALALVPTVSDTAADVTCSWTDNTSLCESNATGATGSLVNLIPVIFIAGLIIGVLFLLFTGRMGQ